MENAKDITIIVTGTGRSGTSVMMRILHEAGVKVLFDDKKRPADISNPNGYFEYPQITASLTRNSPEFQESRRKMEEERMESVSQNAPEEMRRHHLKRLEQMRSITPEQRALQLEQINKVREQKGLPPIPVRGNNQWLDEIRGGAVKILPNNLLQSLPLDRKYAVVFMRRDFSEVAGSYYSYLQNRPYQTKELETGITKEEFIKEWSEKFSKGAQEALDYLKNHSENFSIIEVEMHKINEQIGEVGKFVSDNLGREVNLVVPPKGS